jgi:tetratricopeptide (TPR) repeat protein
MRASSLIITFFVVSLVSYSQNKISCLTESQLLNLQGLSYTGAGSFLAREGWSRNEEYANQTGQYFGYNLDYNVAVWQKRSTSYIESKLYLYYRNGKPNLLIYQAINECFENLREIQVQNRQIKTSKADHISYLTRRENGVSIDFRDYSNDNSLARFSIIIYNETSVNEAISSEKARLEAIARARADSIEAVRVREEALRLAEVNRLNSLSSYLGQADNLFNIGNYEEALRIYETAKKYLTEGEKNMHNRISGQMQRSRENLNRILIEKTIAEGNSHNENREYKPALESYERALAYFNDSTSNFDSGSNIENQIRKKISEAKSGLDILTLRKTPQLYSNFEPDQFLAFRNKNNEVINSIVYSSGKSGSLSFSSVIRFDTLGTNNSYIEVESASNNRIRSNLDRINYSGLEPVQIRDYYIPINERIEYKIAWNSFPLEARSKFSKIKFGPEIKQIQNSKANIESFVNQQVLRNGVFKFEVFDKTINNKKMSDVTLVSYKNNSGPGNCLYSLFMPGWGTRKVTNGEKGRGRMALFLLSAVVSTGSKIYSDLEYNKYSDPNSGSNDEEQYNIANTANRVSLISGGIAACIYIHDFFWVFGKGIKNNSLNINLKKRLKSGPIKIIESSIQE